MKTASHQTGVVWMAAVVDFVVLPVGKRQSEMPPRPLDQLI